jgi:hypothetical protein
MNGFEQMLEQWLLPKGVIDAVQPQPVNRGNGNPDRPP